MGHIVQPLPAAPALQGFRAQPLHLVARNSPPAFSRRCLSSLLSSGSASKTVQLSCGRLSSAKEVMATDSSGIKTIPSDEVLAVWRGAKAVCFDVDSTVCVDEGIDELAAYLGAGEAVAAWTAKAMGGNVPFQDALSARLELMTPSRDSVDAFLKANPPRLSKGIDTLVSTLQHRWVRLRAEAGASCSTGGYVCEMRPGRAAALV
ncbi:hypothetical protein CYMTET_4935, partial [Cymbomonas tetramitiformis]